MNVEYPYKPTTGIMILAAALFGSCAVFFANHAATNARGLILNRVFVFTAREASIMYWVLAAGTMLLMAMAVFGFAASLLSKGKLILTPTDIIVPRSGLSRRHIVVALNDIIGTQIRTVYWQRYLIILHGAGELSIAKSMLPDAAAFDHLCAALGRREALLKCVRLE